MKSRISDMGPGIEGKKLKNQILVEMTSLVLGLQLEQFKSKAISSDLF